MAASEYARVAEAFAASGRSVPFITAHGLTLVWLFPGGWHVGSTEILLTRLADGDRDAVVYDMFRKCEGDPLDWLRQAAPKKGK